MTSKANPLIVSASKVTTRLFECEVSATLQKLKSSNNAAFRGSSYVAVALEKEVCGRTYRQMAPTVPRHLPYFISASSGNAFTQGFVPW